MEKIAIIAGSGNLPYLFYKEASKKGHEVHIISLFENVDENLKTLDNFVQISLNDIQQGLTYLFLKQIKNVVMLGKVEKNIIFQDKKLSPILENMLKTSKDKKDQTLILKIIQFLETTGIKVLNQNYLLDEFITQNKIYTSCQPTDLDLDTIKIGKEAAIALTTLDVGQTIVVKNSSVISIEGIEGTDETIARAYKYAGESTIIVKMARPNQDMRVDIPVIGINTIKIAIKNKVKGIVFESDKMLFVNQKESIKLAQDNNIFIIGVN